MGIVNLQEQLATLAAAANGTLPIERVETRVSFTPPFESDCPQFHHAGIVFIVSSLFS